MSRNGRAMGMRKWEKGNGYKRNGKRSGKRKENGKGRWDVGIGKGRGNKGREEGTGKWGKGKRKGKGTGNTVGEMGKGL